MRIAALWSRLADYSTAFFRELASRHGCEIQIVYYAAGGDLSFHEFDVSFAASALRIEGSVPADLQERVRQFRPDVVFMPGWNFSHYMTVARRLHRQGVKVVVGLDNPWRGDLRQRLGCLVAPWFLRPTVDLLFAAGERQVQFARHLGYGRKVFQGLYSANVARFSAVRPFGERPAKFLYVGRLIERKGLRALLAAYTHYRNSVPAPMPLVVAGKGALEQLCARTDGVEMRGFVQPSDLPALFSEAQCLVLPSFIEHWGVVLHEAAAAALPIIASSACGATVRFLQDGANGYSVTPDLHPIAAALLDFHAAGMERRAEMSAISQALGHCWTPQLQAAQFMRAVQTRCVSRSIERS